MTPNSPPSPVSDWTHKANLIAATKFGKAGFKIKFGCQGWSVRYMGSRLGGSWLPRRPDTLGDRTQNTKDSLASALATVYSFSRCKVQSEVPNSAKLDRLIEEAVKERPKEVVIEVSVPVPEYPGIVSPCWYCRQIPTISPTNNALPPAWNFLCKCGVKRFSAEAEDDEGRMKAINSYNANNLTIFEKSWIDEIPVFFLGIYLVCRDCNQGLALSTVSNGGSDRWRIFCRCKSMTGLKSSYPNSVDFVSCIVKSRNPEWLKVIPQL